MISITYKNFTLRRGLIAATIIFLMIVGYRILSERGGEDSAQIRIPEVTVISVDDFRSDRSIVTAIGEVESVDQLELRSQLNSQVAVVNNQIGDKVKRGQIIVELDHAASDAQLSQAAATIARMQGMLDQRMAGATEQEISQTKAAVEQAEEGVESAKTQLAATALANDQLLNGASTAFEKAQNDLSSSGTNTKQLIKNAYVNLRLAVQSSAPSVLSVLTLVGDIIGLEPGDPSANYYFKEYLGAKNAQTKNSTIISFNAVKISYNESKSAVGSLKESSAYVDVKSAAEIMKKTLNDSLSLLDNAREMLNYSITTASFPESQLNLLKNSIDGQITLINVNLSAVTNNGQAVVLAEQSESSNIEAVELAFSKALADLENARSTADNNLIAAESMVRIQEAALLQAEASLALITSPPREVDLSTLRASVGEAQAAYRIIAVNKEKAIFRAPFNGTVASMPVRAGELVSPGSIVASLVNTDGYQVKVYVNENQRMYFNKGSKALIESEFSAEIFKIAPSIDPSTKKIEVLINIIDESPRLTVGQFVEVRILREGVGSEDNEYLLPLASIKASSQSAYVFFINDDKRLVEREVGLGRVVGDTVEVVGGLSVGMSIVSSVRGLKAGQEVAVDNSD